VTQPTWPDARPTPSYAGLFAILPAVLARADEIIQ
jgi:hypothetical protein